MKAGSIAKVAPKDTRTEWQKHSLRVLVLTLLKVIRNAAYAITVTLVPTGMREREIEPEEWVKACPCFDAENNWKGMRQKSRKVLIE